MFTNFKNHVFDQQYRVIDVLGRGGSGVVFQVHDLRLNRTVALKALLDPDRKALLRFSREIQMQSRIHDPHVVEVYACNLSETCEWPYFVMELLQGKTLYDTLLAPGAPKLALTDALGWLKRIAQGVQALHRIGLIHRDLKPSNIWVEPNGQIKVLDLGIAISAEANVERLTRTGSFLGTIGYMAPEQATGVKELTPAVDVYALGCLLYQLLSGRLPIVPASNNVLEYIYDVSLKQPPLLEQVASGVGNRQLNDFLARSLYKDPTKRYPTAQDWLKNLERVEAGLSGTQPIITLPTAAGPGNDVLIGEAVTRPGGEDRSRLIRLGEPVLGAGVAVFGFAATRTHLVVWEPSGRLVLWDWVSKPLRSQVLVTERRPHRARWERLSFTVGASAGDGLLIALRRADEAAVLYQYDMASELLRRLVISPAYEAVAVSAQGNVLALLDKRDQLHRLTVQADQDGLSARRLDTPLDLPGLAQHHGRTDAAINLMLPPQLRVSANGQIHAVYHRNRVLVVDPDYDGDPIRLALRSDRFVVPQFATTVDGLITVCNLEAGPRAFSLGPPTPGLPTLSALNEGFTVVDLVGDLAALITASGRLFVARLDTSTVYRPEVPVNVSVARFAPDGRSLAAAGADGCVYIVPVT
jgi:hypothetical protein